MGSASHFPHQQQEYHPVSPSWTITYDDGERNVDTSAAGKLSLDVNWAFVLDNEAIPPVIVLAIPRQRVVAINVDE